MSAFHPFRPQPTQSRHKRSASSAHEPLHSLPSYINHEYAAVASDCDIVGYAELTVIIAETAETGEDPAAQINLHSA